MLLRLVHDEATGIQHLQLASLTDAEGNQRREEVVGDAPLGRPPVERELQAKGREILAQIAEVNRYWLGLPPKEVRSYRYTLTAMGDGPGRGTKEYEVRDDSGESFPAGEMEATHAKRHGITYFSALHYMAAHPEDVSFRQVEVGEDEIRLAYFFKNRVWFAASYCLFASRNGFHLSFWDIREGTVVLDRQTLTPREHVNPWFRETFSDYVEIKPDRYAPLKVRFKRFDYRSHPGVQWEFKVHKPGLWLFHTDRHASKEGETKIMASVDKVKVNGKPAELMFAPDKITATGDDVRQILKQLVEDGSAEKQRNREDSATPWGEEVSGLRMRLTKADDEKSANIPLALELRNTTDAPFWLERLWDVYHVEATDASGGRVHLGNRLDPPGPWTTRKTDIQPGETIRWTDWYGRFRRTQPPDGNGQVRIRFFLPLRRARADEPDLSVFTNWLTLPTLDPRQIADEADLPHGWSGVQSFVCVHNPGGLSPPRQLHIDGQGHARLVRPPWGYEDKVVPYGRYETRLGKEQLDSLLRLFREQRIWEVDKPKLPSVSDDGELGFSLVADKTSLVRSFPGMFVEKRPSLRALQSEMERLMAKVVDQATKEGTAFPVEFTGPSSRLLAQAWARLVAESTDKVTGGMRGVDVDLVARQLNETYPTVLSATAEEQRQFSRRQFPDAENTKSFSACAEKLEKHGTLPEIGPFLIRKLRASELKGDELEVARRFLEAAAGDPNVEKGP